jgi:predicted dehydrogenase
VSHHVGAPLWLVGAGAMGIEHARALLALDVPFTAIGRSSAAAARFREKTGVDVVEGGLAAALGAHGPPAAAIVSVGVEALHESCAALLDAGVKRLLIEKPAGVDVVEVDDLVARAAQTGAVCHVAYNRRTYASVLRAQELIESDGGVLSVHFEFTELADRVAVLDRPAAVKAAWFFANSVHVVDLAFFFAGAPQTWSAHVQGGTSFHPAASRFVGSGVTARGALFSYCANWDSGGRWGVEVMTPKRRLILRPLEELAEQKRGEIPVAAVPLGDNPELGAKPGVRRMLERWWSSQSSSPSSTLPTSTLPTLTEHARFFRDTLEPMLRGTARAGAP